MPAVPDIDLEIGVEIHRRSGVLKPHVRQVTGGVASWDIKAAAEGDGRVRKIAADAKALADDFARRRIRAAAAPPVMDIAVKPVANRLDPREPVLKLAKLPKRKIHQPIGVAISARKRVAQERGRQIAHRNRVATVIVVLGLGRTAH